MIRNHARAVATLLVVAATLASGCGRQMAAPPDMQRAPTEHPPLWPIVKNGGTVQAAPEIYTVVWQGDEQLGADVADFLSWMLTSDYWQALAEYGVGAGVSKGLIVLPTPPPPTLTDDDVRALVVSLMTSGQVQANANTQVAFLPNPATAVSGSEGTGCDTFAGYHEHVDNPAGKAAYSLSLRCTGEAGDALDQVTDVLSHEASEAATDPVPPTGYIAGPPSPTPYEIADLCNFNSSMSVAVAPDATHATARRYWVQRLYSGKRALDGTSDPCLPLPWDRPYWNVALDPEVIDLAANGSASVAAQLDVFAYGDVGEIKWFAVSADGMSNVTPDHGTAHAGDTIPVTITLGSTKPGVNEIDVLSESEKAGATMWFSYVRLK